MFEITGDDIALLNDVDLRALIGRLCEAELRKASVSPSGVTWGGNQTARDGGLDVVVELPTDAMMNGFIPKAKAGFQVKKSDMPRGQILDEMKPGGTLRPVIADLAKSSGAYIIVSADGSTADSALQARRQAMRDALDGLAEAENLLTDFYDRTRVATWVRDHPGLIPWVKAKIGKTLQAWQSFGSWSYPAGKEDNAYLCDDESRVKTGHSEHQNGLSAVDGVQHVRSMLSNARKSVRLVGLSGVGKTRFCEALFDDKVGSSPLDPSLAIYADVADGPSPTPISLVSDLIANRTRAILILDNCPADLHRRLAEVIQSPESELSLITVEYDIREDQTEGTDVVSLETSSQTLIQQLVARRYPEISRVDTDTIAEFSGGNARVALALAATMAKTESIAGLSDAELFKRLFQQKHADDPDLTAIAEACSLVYSFEGTKLQGDGAELLILAGLARRPVDEVYAGVAELKRRGLLQQRSEWRAILPHAIANRLAARALENIAPDTVNASLASATQPRLRRSFSRRLGFLHTSKQAQTIVREWLKPGGWLTDLPNLDEEQRTILNNVAPVEPSATIAMIERVVLESDASKREASRYVASLARSLAYDDENFARCIAVLIALAELKEDAPSNDDDPVGIIRALFQIVLSGTRAKPSTRLQIVRDLLASSEESRRKIGMIALSAMLKSDQFHSGHSFDFGSRSRDYGYDPRTTKEVKSWFDGVIQIAVSLALGQSPEAEQARTMIVNEFRGLWVNAEQMDALEDLSKKLSAVDFWRDGWIAARRTRMYSGKTLSPESLARLTTLEEFLRPKDLVNKIRGLVIENGQHGRAISLDDFEVFEHEDISTSMERTNTVVVELGENAAADEAALTELLSDLFEGGHRVGLFGKGVAKGAERPEALWATLLQGFSARADANCTLIGGFLEGMRDRDPELCEKLLDEALSHPSLGRYIVFLQAYVGLNPSGVERLHKALELEIAPTLQFQRIAWGRATDELSGPVFRELVLAIASKPDGVPAALEIISKRLFTDQSDKRPTVPEVVTLGRELLLQVQFQKRNGRVDREDRQLGSIVNACLPGNEGVPVARRLVREVFDAIERDDVYAFDMDDVLAAVLKVHPIPVLDEVFSRDKEANEARGRMFVDMRDVRANPMDSVPDETVLEWCAVEPEMRYALAATAVTLYRRATAESALGWTPIVEQLIAGSTDAKQIFGIIEDRLRPMSWSGSLASKLEGRLQLLHQLPIGNRTEIADEVAGAKARLVRRIEREKLSEAEYERATGERFE
ncbi:hypothetical protein APY04_3515 [Hyphomicrobium sulfonivorans]|uniref:Uncharacterized protein n=1 Tax=Hyphomicrobium sulfonivorans TaxID=121290 RepID=A0A109B8P0_HYPSL|nr:hypothetical protein [Hyphomicrobium sulfonivorans]KWT64251.1 hypothetical protein APY04_3515 [Hyphomicrobium sulfonivorans]